MMNVFHYVHDETKIDFFFNFMKKKKSFYVTEFSHSRLQYTEAQSKFDDDEKYNIKYNEFVYSPLFQQRSCRHWQPQVLCNTARKKELQKLRTHFIKSKNGAGSQIEMRKKKITLILSLGLQENKKFKLNGSRSILEVAKKKAIFFCSF